MFGCDRGRATIREIEIFTCGSFGYCFQGMSGTLNHSPSMDLRSEGLGGRLEGSGGPHSALQPTGGGPHQQHSPLQHFVQV